MTGYLCSSYFLSGHTEILVFSGTALPERFNETTRYVRSLQGKYEKAMGLYTALDFLQALEETNHFAEWDSWNYNFVVQDGFKTMMKPDITIDGFNEVRM